MDIYSWLRIVMLEVDVMPFLSRADWGGPFDGYYEALSNLGAEFDSA